MTTTTRAISEGFHPDVIRRRGGSETGHPTRNPTLKGSNTRTVKAPDRKKAPVSGQLFQNGPEWFSTRGDAQSILDTEDRG
jgi:hypothetical protein